MKLVVAPNAFKESMSPVVAAHVMRDAAAGSCFSEIVVIPIGDGGDGTLEALAEVVGGETVAVDVHDPLGNPIKATLLLWDGRKKAFVEMAKASGLALVPPELRNPVRTSTYGTGELIKAAIEMGAEEIIIGVGGSATVDGGLGALEALGFRFTDAKGAPVRRGGAGLLELSRFEPPSGFPKAVKIRIMADVRNPLLGTEGAARVYGPQKGASEAEVEMLEGGLERLAKIAKEMMGVDISTVEGGGAAGGIAAAFYGFLGASIENGGELFLELVGFDEKVRGASLVLTGEGKLDRQTAYGKGVAAVAKHASRLDIPVVAFAAIIEDRDVLHSLGITAAISIIDRPELSVEKGIADGEKLLASSVREIIRLSCGLLGR